MTDDVLKQATRYLRFAAGGLAGVLAGGALALATGGIGPSPARQAEVGVSPPLTTVPPALPTPTAASSSPPSPAYVPPTTSRARPPVHRPSVVTRTRQSEPTPIPASPPEPVSTTQPPVLIDPAPTPTETQQQLPTTIPTETVPKTDRRLERQQNRGYDSRQGYEQHPEATQQSDQQDEPACVVGLICTQQGQ